MAEAPVLVERRGAIALLTLNRPDKHNALSLAFLARLETLMRELGDDASVRVIVISGNPRCFSTGMDLDDLDEVRAVADTQRVLGRARDANAAIERCPRPVIAAIAGWCLTGGLELALACDIRVAADTARFGVTSARIGTVAGMGGTQRLPRLIGPGRAKEVLFSAEPVDAAEAFRLGIVNRVVPAGQEVEAAAPDGTPLRHARAAVAVVREDRGGRGADHAARRGAGVRDRAHHPALHDGGPRRRAARVPGKVLYPTVGMMLCNHPDFDFKQACFAAYNEWIGEYASAHPHRLLGRPRCARSTTGSAICNASGRSDCAA
jgi:enoyl-CoA hydratase/carnithine racemase